MNNIFVKSRLAGSAGVVGVGFLLLLTITTAQAQVRRGTFLPYSTVGLGVGTSSYYGDLAGYTTPLSSTFELIRYHATGNYTRHFTPRFAARASFTWARIVGDDYTLNNSGAKLGTQKFARNLHFRNDLKEFAAIGIYKLVPDGRTADRRPQLSPYVFAGLAAVAHNPMARTPEIDGGRWVRLQPLGTEGQGNPGSDKPYSLVQLAIPLGFGVRYKLHPKWDVSAEVGFRLTTTDYLDDVSDRYADPNVLKDDIARAMANRSAEPTTARKGKDRTEGLRRFLAAEPYNIETNDPFVAIQQTPYGEPGSVRGNPAIKDSYLLGTIHINYILGSTIKCPPIK
ncbi:DUF6089 family protein [Telluribacter sp.]|jgi:hypothetical protein|uniref:DUF6089 family protein n=1 Tax=Telluribacter sp. TaxID=1978767 RepID=UPI002E12A2E3|nr:DUF6089 family protein [Telluribacter sp.]